MASTWYRDSHGLYDYEEDNKISISHFKASQGCKYILEIKI